MKKKINELIKGDKIIEPNKLAKPNEFTTRGQLDQSDLSGKSEEVVKVISSKTEEEKFCEEVVKIFEEKGMIQKDDANEKFQI